MGTNALIALVKKMNNTKMNDYIPKKIVKKVAKIHDIFDVVVKIKEQYKDFGEYRRNSLKIEKGLNGDENKGQRNNKANEVIENKGMYMYICIYVYICIHVDIYIYVYI
jgi:predicted component of type VI protein secretion system